MSVGESLRAAKQHITFSLGLNFCIKKNMAYKLYEKKYTTYTSRYQTIFKAKQTKKTFLKTYVNKEVQG